MPSSLVRHRFGTRRRRKGHELDRRAPWRTRVTPLVPGTGLEAISGFERTAQDLASCSQDSNAGRVDVIRVEPDVLEPEVARSRTGLLSRSRVVEELHAGPVGEVQHSG